MANAFLQSNSRSVFLSPLTLVLPNAVQAGSLLIANVDSFVSGANGASLPIPGCTISTPSIIWTLIASFDVHMDPWVDATHSQRAHTDIYAAYNVPAIPSCVTTIQATTQSAAVAIYEFSCSPVITGLSAITQSFDGNKDNGAPYTISAGSVSVGAGDILLVFARAFFVGSEPSQPPPFTGGPGLFQYILNSAGGIIDTSFGPPTAFGFGAAALFPEVGIIVGSSGCGTCPQPTKLDLIPGFSDLPDSVLQADDPAFSLHLGEIATNATFGMVRLEIFPCPVVHGDVIPLPTSCWDGYKYSRDELTYIWAVQNSTDHATNWISGPDSLWFSNWNVNQDTGEVFSEEWYERSSTADTRLAAKSNDGLLMVFTVAQRQKTNMIMAATATYNAISEATIASDKPYTQDLAQHLNQNAKFSCVNTEVFYLGEYINGNTVDLSQAVSPVDGYAYSAAECKFIHSWRWTSSESNYIQPPGNYEQAAPFQASISAAGLVSITVTFSTSGGNGVVTAPNYGRIAAFAFCRRSATPSSGSLANNFTELDLGYFAPGRTVRASELLTIKRNIDEAILSPEFFGPTEYADSSSVALPVSPVDGYAYSRDEVQYVWSWSKVINNSGGTHVRLPLFLGGVGPDTGKVALKCWRLPPGGPFVDDSNVNARVSVIVMATRQASHPALTSVTTITNANTPSDSATAPIDTSIIQINGA